MFKNKHLQMQIYLLLQLLLLLTCSLTRTHQRTPNSFKICEISALDNYIQIIMPYRSHTSTCIIGPHHNFIGLVLNCTPSGTPSDARIHVFRKGKGEVLRVATHCICTIPQQQVIFTVTASRPQTINLCLSCSIMLTLTSKMDSANNHISWYGGDQTFTAINVVCLTTKAAPAIQTF